MKLKRSRVSEWCSRIQDYLGEEFGYEVEKWQVLAVLLLSVLLVLGGVAIYGRSALAGRGHVKEVPKPAVTKPDERELVVYVCGAVQRPAVCRLKTGARVMDALAAAGGAAADADTSRLNLARPLADGERIYVARAGEAMAAGEGDDLTQDAKVNINRASVDELDTLPGIGPAIGERIVNYRREHGRFERIEQLQDIDGIGPSKFKDLKDRVVV